MKLTCVKIVVAGVLFAVCLALSSCYQVHSDDDLRGVPVTNNPNVVPNHGGMGRFTAMQP